MYGVDRPSGVAATSDGSRVYVAQSGTDRTVAMLDANGTKIGTLQPPVSTGAEHAPVYVAIDPTNGEVYVSDRPTGAIYIYNANGDYQRAFAPAVARPGWQPIGLAFDPAGNLYVVDLAGQPPQVVKFDRSGLVVQTFGASDSLNFANCIAVDGDGNVYLTDSNNGRLIVYDKNGVKLATVGRGAGEGNLGLPRGIVVDTQGHVDVMDTSAQAGFVYQHFQAGQTRLDYIGAFGSQGVDNGQFLYPTGLAADGRGHLYVADTANSRIQVWSY
jgi:DNA-binding beta-propeller fold protein YncE